MADRPSDERPTPDDALPEIDLGTLADGVRPTDAQWAEITDTATHRRHRRAWLLSAAALVVLIAGTAGVVVVRDGTTGTIEVAAGGDPAPFAYVLPPEGATVADPEERFAYYSYSFAYEGRTYFFGGAHAGVVPDDPGSVSGFTAPTELPAGLAQVEVDGLGTVTFACPSDLLPPGYQPSASSPDGTVPLTEDGVEWWLAGPPQALWSMGGYAASLSERGVEGLCDPADQPDGTLEATLRQMRTGGRAEWELLLSPSEPELDSESHPGTTSPTTPPEAPPEDRGSAEDQIRAAVERLTTSAEDETYPYLEDGVARANEYTQMFETAGRQAGARPVDGQPTTDFSLGWVRFDSPERARFSMDMDTRLQGRSYQFSQDGAAIVQDGRWVITYDTIVRMLSRACLPPGGVSSECPGR
jgi:hypothetical protein